MKKLSIFLLVLLLALSFSGCLKDDYESLEAEIDNLYQDSDSLKDDIDEITLSIEDIKEKIAEAEDKQEELAKLENTLYSEKENIEESIDIVSDIGLGITKFEFEEAFFGLDEFEDYYDDVYMSYLPYQTMTDLGRTLYYYTEIEGETSSLFYYGIVLCEDNHHIKEMYYMIDEYIVDNYKDMANKYLYAFCVSFVMAKSNYMNIESAYNIVDVMLEDEPVYNNTVQYDISYNENGYYLVSITTISK